VHFILSRKLNVRSEKLNCGQPSRHAISRHPISRSSASLANITTTFSALLTFVLFNAQNIVLHINAIFHEIESSFYRPLFGDCLREPALAEESDASSTEPSQPTARKLATRLRYLKTALHIGVTDIQYIGLS
jgi:hypothetical protein